MIEPCAFLAFVAASVVALAIPGPTVALVLARSLSSGRRVAVPLCLGIGGGTLVGSAVALSGAGAALSASAAAFTALKWLGAAYLVYLGTKLFRAEPNRPAVAAEIDQSSAVEGLRDGFLVTLLNPKSIAFSAAFIPQFISAEASYLGQSALLVAMFAALATLNGLVFALGTDALHRVIRRVDTLRWVNRAGGCVLVACGAAALFLKRPAT